MSKKRNRIADIKPAKKQADKIVTIDSRNEDIKNVKARYEFNRPGKRKHVYPETTGEEGESLLSPRTRQEGIATVRDLGRNFSSINSFWRQFKNGVVGTAGGKVSFRTDNPEWSKKASTWFNSVWSKECDSRSDLHFNEILQIAEQTVKAEGDFLIVFDNFRRDDGKCLFYEADQICEIEESEWKQQTVWVETIIDAKGKKKIIPLEQNSGVVFDREGREVAYIVTSKHGQQTVKFEEATIYPTTVAKLVRNRHRFNLLRGVAESLSIIGDLADISAMRSLELASAKRATRVAGKVKKLNADQEALFRGGNALEGLATITDGTAPATEQKKNYEKFEELTGGIMQYLNPGEDFEILPLGDRPAPNVASFFDFVLRSAGASLGLADCYSTLKTSASYSAARAEMLITWATFYNDQKLLERHCADWCCKKAITWAVEKGILPTPPEGWECGIIWSWPVMPALDLEKEYNALIIALKNGLDVDYEKILGAGWKEKMEAAAEKLLFFKSLGMPLAAFETKSGGEVNKETSDTNNNNDKVQS